MSQTDSLIDSKNGDMAIDKRELFNTELPLKRDESKDAKNIRKIINEENNNQQRNDKLVEQNDDEQGEDKKRKISRLSTKRFGHAVKFDKYKTSNLIKIICITLAIIIIPLEIFVQNVLQEQESNLIVNIQASFGDSQGLKTFFNIPLFLFMPQTTCFFMFLLYASSDSLIAFKSAILTCFGIYIITFLKLLYKDGRPFWLSNEITGFECSFDFGGPGFHLFIISFFWSYNIIMYCMKYAEKVNRPLVYSLFGLLFFLGVWVIIAGLYSGTIFIYQNIIGLLYGLIYLVLCMNFDTEIHRMCEKTGFIVQSSRKYKFYLFFLCIGLFVVALVYYNSELDYWTMPQSWIVNASEPTEICRDRLLQTSNNRLGLDQTFYYTGILFFITGMGFGTSFSLVHVDCLDWVHTSIWKRILRSIIGCLIAVGVFWGFISIPCNDNPTRYFFQFVCPSLLLSFFIYGVFPIFCQKINLVKIRDDEEEEDYEEDDEDEDEEESEDKET